MKKVKLPILSTVLVLLLVMGIWLLTGFYTLRADGGEQGVITRFGSYVRTDDQAGLKWHLPAPIESVEIVRAGVVRTLEIGYRTQTVGGTQEVSEFLVVPEEALMITGDENLVNTETVIQFRINNVHDFIFNVDDPLGTLRTISESTIRRVVAAHGLDDVLTDQKEMIQREILTDLQVVADMYGLGVDISNVALQSVYAPLEVTEAFDDVIKAREDMARFINEAEKRSNEIVPASQAKAQEILNEAISYRARRIAEARGEVSNFVQVREQYILAQDVTRTRMFLEVMERVLPSAKIYIMQDEGDTLRYISLDNQGTQPSPAPIVPPQPNAEQNDAPAATTP